MFLELTRVTQEAYFDVCDPKWGSDATTKDIYRSMTTTTILVNCDHVVAIEPKAYKHCMYGNTPPHNAQDKWLADVVGTLVILVTGKTYTVTETVSQIDGAIGTQYVVEKC